MNAEKLTGSRRWFGLAHRGFHLEHTNHRCSAETIPFMLDLTKSFQLLFREDVIVTQSSSSVSLVMIGIDQETRAPLKH